MEHEGIGMIRRLKCVRAFGIAVTCSLLLLFSGCSNAEPDVADSDESAVKLEGAQTTEGYTLPPRPEITRPQEPTLTGDEQTDALAVAQHFLEFYPYMLKTGDISYWEQHTDTSCERCIKMIREISESKTTGEWVDSSILITDVVAEKMLDSSGDYLVSYLVTRENVVHYEVDKTREEPDENYHVLIRIGQHDSEWKVADFLIGTPETFEKAKEHAYGK